MQQNRPTSVTVIAILQFVFGGLGLLMGICGGGYQFAGGNKMFATAPQAAQNQQIQTQMEDFLKEKVPSAKPVQYATMALDLILCLIMIASGVGLLKLQPWGRMLAIVYAIFSILLKLFGAIYGFLFSIPAVTEFLEKTPAQNPQEAMVFNVMKATLYVTPFLSLVFIVYPLIVLIIMMRPSIAAAFRAGPIDDSFDDREESPGTYPDDRFR
jgi:hypothetical protein